MFYLLKPGLLDAEILDVWNESKKATNLGKDWTSHDFIILSSILITWTNFHVCPGDQQHLKELGIETLQHMPGVGQNLQVIIRLLFYFFTSQFISSNWKLNWISRIIWMST